jgi:hypothetical protein
MIRVLVMANHSLLADSIASILAEEINLDVVRVTHRTLGKGDRYSVVIIVDEGESETELRKVTDLFRDDITMLVIKLSLKSRNIFVYESYQLNNPGMERVIDLVRDFGKTNLKKKIDDEVNISALRKTNRAPLFEVYADPLARDL